MGAATQAGVWKTQRDIRSSEPPRTQCQGTKPCGGEEATPKATASPLPAPGQGPLGSAFQTNRRDSLHQRDLEEKMVHKVTMDTVKIITSAVSGMTHVSECPPPPAPCQLGWRAAQWLMLGWLRLGGMVRTQNSAPLLLLFLLPGMPVSLDLPHA